MPFFSKLPPCLIGMDTAARAIIERANSLPSVTKCG